jgi:hypothetical protein
MPYVVPSQVRVFIEQEFRPSGAPIGPNSQLFREWSPQLSALVALAEQIPDHLISLTGPTYSQYVMALETIKYQLSTWLHSVSPTALAHVGGQSAVFVIREALQLCSDEAPAPATAGLGFISDTDLSASVRLDISAAERDLVGHEYKGATVLAGSAIEALLLWAILEYEKNHVGSFKAAAAALRNSGILSKTPHSDIEQWHLSDLIEVARHLSLISEETATQARLAKDFRNLIHPGRARRLDKMCDRATALSALAAVAHVVRDLSGHFL